ncbi:A disintegrin and metalloproteinase with thrombospondin motifs 9-like isoform X4 [Amphibalanus amphitrite]|uniref:A disintegrin and metalloproteinase with thrombospondin motifs 9-like isoform X4 n=1 Tax=Amphibalanus amphitrite TaxID=1232801 RepID=UPI001C91D6C7|nr:A disintegrin and metalloproteinase with thrombospondin motifs 9-like isoform X4 [Amphibalanus amphitrite]
MRAALSALVMFRTALLVVVLLLGLKAEPGTPSSPATERTVPQKLAPPFDPESADRHHLDTGTFSRVSALLWDPHPRYSVRAFGRRLVLLLEPDALLAAPELPVQRVYRNFTEVRGLGRPAAHCLYRGMVEDDADSVVAVSLCHGMTGHIRTSESNYLIWPSDKEADDPDEHVIQMFPGSESHTAPTAAPEEEDSDEQGRRRRSTSHAHHMEVMVAADARMADYHGDQLEQYILTLMSIVALIYKDPSIGNSVTVSLGRIIRLEDDLLEEEVEAEEDGSKSSGKSASALLHNFCKWQQKHAVEEKSSSGYYDTAVLLTREDICRNPQRQQCDTLGLAELGTMCDSKASCSIIQDNGLSAAFTVAHELGHVLNIPHDDDSKCQQYMGSEKVQFVMSRMLDHNTFPWSWSKCSRHYLTEYLDAGYGDCLRKQPKANYRRHSEPSDQLALGPAGQTYDATQQCKLVFGDEFEICSYMPTCKRLWCSRRCNGTDCSEGCRTQHMPWADGTTCAPGRWCQRGECVSRTPRPDTVHGGWGQWGEWGQCSRSCGGGIRRSERGCNAPVPSNGGTYCLGQRVRYESCNRQECPKGSVDFREAQCATFNGNNFNIQGLPSDVQWVPKYTGIKNKDRCKLFCRVADSSAYYLLKERVVDGTTCTPDTDDMCVNGICEPAGCDHILHSDVHADQCGVCGGDNSTCHVIKGYFDKSTQKNIHYGYNRVVRVPAGATRLDVRQKSNDHTSKDDNYLALLDPETREYILNGNFVVSMFKKVMQYGGVLLEYTGSDSVVERINCSKPLEKELELYVLSVGNLASPNVEYEYTVSVERPETYQWQLSPHWSACDRVCQGTRYREVQCVRRSDSVSVSESHCSRDPRPDREEVACNLGCTLIWKVTHRSECSSSCGPGTRRAQSQCFQSFPGALQIDLSPIQDHNCQHLSDRPALLEACQGACEPTRWRFGDWSECSRTCGGGTQERTAVCVTSTGSVMADTYCDHKERFVSQPCGHTECPSWRVGNWSTCSVTCGQGVSRRTVLCVAPDGHRIDDALCEGQRPETSRACERPVCPPPTAPPPTSTPAAPRWSDPATNLIDHYRNYVWRWGNWSECSVTCGRGVKSRSVACYNSRTGHVQPKEACRHMEQPRESKPCQQAFCGEWRFGNWSACSATCGQSLKRRQVTCVSVVSSAPLEEEQCDNSTRPAALRSCPFVSCPPAPASTLSNHITGSDWVTGAWGECSRSCGGGFQQRQVRCRTSDGDGASSCDPNTRPSPTGYCNTEPCPQWSTGQWSECNATCGSGTHMRRVRCQDHLGQLLADHQCSAADRPSPLRPCQLPSCPRPASRQFRWRVSRWSKCSQSCGIGVQYRRPSCHRLNMFGWRDPEPAPDALCAARRRPQTVRKCHRSCSTRHRWKTSPWSQCSSTCGNNGHQLRKVRCVNARGKHVSRRHCLKSERPRRRRRCGRRPCGPLSCLEARDRLGTRQDGEYYLIVAGSNTSIYCHGMNSSQPPLEFLTLPTDPPDVFSNFAEIDAKRLLQPHTCPRNGSRISAAQCRECVRARSPHAGFTVFTKVRLNITSLNIIPRDFTFANTSGRGRPVNYGEAGDCYSSAGCPQGRFSINLRGTGLRVAAATHWVGVGNKSTVRIHTSRGRTLVTGTCGGYCGTCRADSPGGIKLDVAPP